MEAINNCCSCGFSPSSISQEQLICDQLAPAEFVYRATLSSYGSYSTGQLLDCIEQWVLSGMTLNYDGSHVTFDPKCLVHISSYDDQPCAAAVTTTQNPSTSSVPLQTFAPSQTPPAAIFVAVVIGCILLCITVVGIILMVCLYVQRKTRKSR